MKFSFASALVLALAADSAVASTWFSKAAYNKWHETELERWLSDHDVSYPKAADRKELQNLVKENWQTYVEQPYNNWDTDRLQAFLESKGEEVKQDAKANKDTLLKQVKSAWYESADQAHSAFDSVKDWIFDSWTESSLKAFLDKHGVPSPQPRTRDTLLTAARENYESIAQKAGEAAAYPGDWLYESWSQSDLKKWLDEHGIPAPQGSNRNKLVAAVRRNARLGSWRANSLAASASATASSAASSGSASVSSAAGSAANALNDKVFEAWSDSNIKAWFDKNGIKVPQGSRRNELLALARKNWAKLTGDDLAAYGSSAYDSASSVVSGYATEASSSGASAASVASKSAASAASVASKSASSAASVASKSGKSAASRGYDSASSAASSGASVLGKSAQSAASVASVSGQSAASVASKSAESAASVLSKSGKSAASVGYDSASSAASKYATDASSAASSAYTDGSSAASSFATDAASSISSGARSAASAASPHLRSAASSASSYYGAATSSAGNEFAKATDDAALKLRAYATQAYSYAESLAGHYLYEAQVAVGLKTNYASSASRSVASASASASSIMAKIKGEL